MSSITSRFGPADAQNDLISKAFRKEPLDWKCFPGSCPGLISSRCGALTRRFCQDPYDPQAAHVRAKWRMLLQTWTGYRVKVNHTPDRCPLKDDAKSAKVVEKNANRVHLAVTQ
jgi:hypothetical protein